MNVVKNYGLMIRVANRIPKTNLKSIMARRILRANAYIGLDWVARMSILEGAAGVTPNKWMHKYPTIRRYDDAKLEIEKYFENLDPTWLEPVDTGLWKRMKAIVSKGLFSANVPYEAEDRMMDGLVGRTQSGADASKPFFYMSGHTLRNAISKGQTDLGRVASTLATFLIRSAIRDHKREVKDQWGGSFSLDEEGEGARSLSPEDINLFKPKNRSEAWFQILAHPTDSLGKQIRNWIRGHWKNEKPAHKAILDTWFDLYLRTADEPTGREIASAMVEERRRDPSYPTVSYVTALEIVKRAHSSIFPKMQDEFWKSPLRFKLEARLTGGGYDQFSNDIRMAKQVRKLASAMPKYRNILLRTLKSSRNEQFARFEEGVPADPTENMSPEDAAEWKRQNEIHKDNFKGASRRKRSNQAPEDINDVLGLLKRIPGVVDAEIIDQWPRDDWFAVGLTLKVLESALVSSRRNYSSFEAPVKFVIGAAQLKRAISKILGRHVGGLEVQFPERLRNADYAELRGTAPKGAIPSGYYEDRVARVEFNLHKEFYSF